MGNNRCVSCGEVIPEGRLVCHNCEKGKPINEKIDAMHELKPCPFCGRKPAKVREHYASGISTIFYTVECKSPQSKCGVNPKTRFWKDPETAIEAWNRRAEDGNKV